MRIPILKGIIERRMLVNYCVDPEVVQRILPGPFRPKLYNGQAITGICLIRLRNIRPKGWPAAMGIASENAAHRFAVEWEAGGETHSGVYIPRRDTSSILNHWAGGRVFPGRHELAGFDVNEAAGRYRVSFRHPDGTGISVDADRADRLIPGSVFENVENASAFFQEGALGYTPDGNGYDGLCLKIDRWRTTPLQVHHLQSSFFENTAVFPEGSIRFDHALLMENVEHEWHARGRL